MKKILPFLLVLVLLVGCLPNPGSPSTPTAQPSQTAVPTESAEDVILHLCEIANSSTGLADVETLEVNGKFYSCQTGKEVDAPESATPEVIPSATQGPTITPMPTNVPADLGTTDCRNHGVTAWQNDNMVDGSVYGEAPVGGLDETCWVVAQTWWEDANGTPHRAVFAVRPHTVVWLSGHKGGTGWYFSGDLASVKANLAQQAQQLLERDGEMDTLTLILSDDEESFPILTRFQVKK